MEENKFGVYFWTLAAVIVETLVIALSVATAISNSNRSELIKSSLAHNQNPVAAVCAYDQPQGAGTVAICAQAIAKGAK